MPLVELPSVMNIATATDLKAQLQTALESSEAIEIDASSVERVDASAIQLLLSFFQEAALRSTVWCWRSVSAELKASAELMGLSIELRLV